MDCYGAQRLVEGGLRDDRRAIGSLRLFQNDLHAAQGGRWITMSTARPGNNAVFRLSVTGEEGRSPLSLRIRPVCREMTFSLAP